jgi:hypothetical protein
MSLAETAKKNVKSFTTDHLLQKREKKDRGLEQQEKVQSTKPTRISTTQKETRKMVCSKTDQRG